MAAEKGLDIKIVGGGRHEEFRVPGPAHAFIPLRTVAGHFEIIAFLAPDDIAVKLIHQRAGTRKGAGPGYVRMHHDARDRVYRGCHGESPDFDITETVESETRLEDHGAV